MEVGSLYQLDHSKLPENILSQLGFIRAVMVGEKTKTRVSVAFPSKHSLEKFLAREEIWLLQPNLDSVYTMKMDLAEDVLSRRIPVEEFAAQRGTRSFWVNHHFESHDFNGDCAGGVKDGLATWGLRKRVTFARKHRDNNDAPVLVKGEAMEEEERDSEEGEYEMEGERELKTRKRRKPRKLVKYVKKKKRGLLEVALSDRCHKQASEINLRWTQERYKLAETSILKILKAKEAVHGNPLLRADLRAEARKLIGDTGLLDHLLKHMAGKLAPGGKERFRRRHNPQGAMEYWLEPADLESIRKEAGVNDPYWIPPEGWKLGDSPTQDPVCAMKLKKLREDVDKMKSEIQELANEQRHDHAAGDVSECLDDAQKTKKFLQMPLKAMQEDLLKRKAKIEEQLSSVSKALTNMEEDLKMLLVEANANKNGATTREAAPTGAIIEASAREISSADMRQRLKSGFRTCRPEGTFLWPDKAAAAGANSSSAQVMIQMEQVLPLSSPSSLCSSESPPPPSPSPSPVFRPIARRPIFGLSVSSVTGSDPEAKNMDKMGGPSPTGDLSAVSKLDFSSSSNISCFPYHPFLINHTSASCRRLESVTVCPLIGSCNFQATRGSAAQVLELQSVTPLPNTTHQAKASPPLATNYKYNETHHNIQN